MIEATRMRSGCACLIRAIRAATSPAACRRSAPSSRRSAAPCPAASASRGAGRRPRRAGTWSSGPRTLTTGCRPIVLVTTPPQPASKARMMLLSDSVGGADDSRNGFSNRSPVKVTASGLPMASTIIPPSASLRCSPCPIRRSSPRPPKARFVPRSGPMSRSSRTSSADAGCRRPATESLDVHNPARGDRHRQDAALDRRAISTPRSRRRARRFPGGARRRPWSARGRCSRSRRCSRSTSRSWPASSPPSTARRSTRRAAASAAASSASRSPAARRRC